MKLFTSIVRLAQTVLALSASTIAVASPIQPQNLLVSDLDSGVLTEYSRQGTVIQKFNTPDFADGFHDLRDIIEGTDGRIHMFNGTFTPQMTTLNPVTNKFSNMTVPEWSTVNNGTYGGIGVLGHNVYATDMFTYNGGEAGGIIRFDLTKGSATRFGTTDYTDLTIGLDGLLYAYSGQVDVYNPYSMQLLRTVNLPRYDVRGIAVNQNGTIFAADWYGGVTKFDSLGQQIGASLVLNTSLGWNASLTDIDVNSNGDLVIGSRFGRVFLTDSALTSWNSFDINGEFGPTVHVAFAVTPVPEPSTYLLLAVGLVLIARKASKSA